MEKFKRLISTSKGKNEKITKRLFMEFFKYKSKKNIEILWDEFKIEIIKYYFERKIESGSVIAKELNTYESLFRKARDYYNKNDKEKSLGYIGKTYKNYDKKIALRYINAKKLDKQKSFKYLKNAGFTFEEITEILGLNLFFISNGSVCFMD